MGIKYDGQEGRYDRVARPLTVPRPRKFWAEFYDVSAVPAQWREQGVASESHGGMRSPR
jgi:hypothetical protein